MRRAAPLAAAVLTAGLSLGGATAAFADTEPYSNGQVPPATEVLGTTLTKTTATDPVSTATSASTLPFTGAELATSAVAGAAALGAGVMLVVAGRRRRAEG